MGEPKNRKVCQEFLEEFVCEAKQLEKNGVTVAGKTFQFSIHSFICDAPARSLIKSTKCHSGYSACDRCTQKGEWHGKIVYPLNLEVPLRTDASFREMNDSEHHHGPSPLNQLNVGLVTQVCLDYMHLVCLGVTRRLILSWMRGPLVCRVSGQCVSQLSATLVSLRSCIPCEFARKPRALAEIDRWKATEFRQFLLYTGPVVLKGCLHDSFYNHFLLLYVGIYLCLSPDLCKQYAEYARELLKLFVQHASKLYGVDILVYNVHCLIHLVDDVLRFGSLDNVSAFPFENHMRIFKKLIRGPSSPLKQIIGRISEQETVSITECVRSSLNLKKVHNLGPLPGDWGSMQSILQYGSLKLHSVTFKTNRKDGYACLASGDICLLRNIVEHGKQVSIVYQRFMTKKPFFEYPLQSSDIGILLISDLSVVLESASVCDLVKKYVCMKYQDSTAVVAVPLAHVE